MSAVDAGAVLTTVTANSVLVRWRRLLLRRWQEMTFISQSFEKLWNEHFPDHDFVTLQLKRRAQNKAELYWEGESWKKAARWYHVNRQGRPLLVEFDPTELKPLRRLLSNDVSLDGACRELNALENRPTPQVTVEAIWHAVRERGLAALNESATRQRLARCDAAALAQIDQRITRLKARG
jgi:hypothetical protein